MQATITSFSMINLFTDKDLRIVQGSGVPDAFTHLDHLLVSVDSNYLKGMQHLCLQQPEVRLEICAPVGVNGHARNLKWQVSAVKASQGIPEGFHWLGVPLAADVPQLNIPIYQPLIESFPGPVFLLDTCLQPVLANKAANLLHADTEPGGNPLIAPRPVLVLPNDLKAVISLALQKAAVWEGAYTWHGTANNPLYFTWKLTPLSTSDGWKGYLLAFQDQTRETLLEQELGRARSRCHLLEEIIDQSGAASWACDVLGNKIFTNTRFLKETRAEGAKDLTLQQLFPESVASKFQRENEFVIRNRTVTTTIEKGPEPHLKEAWFRTVRFPVETPEGVLAAGFAYDVTHEYQQEQELNYLRQRFEIAATITADIIGDWDIVNDSLWRSDPFTDILVHSSKARSMKERYERVHPGDRSRFINSLQEALDSGAERWGCEYQYKAGTADGLFKILNEKGVIFRNAEGIPVRMISVVRDVTEKRTLEQILRKKEQEVLTATIEGQENERNELARELHDNVGQVLAMCKLFVDITADSLQHEYLDKCRDHLNRAIKEIRSLSHRLSPEVLERKGLPGAVSDLVANINETGKLKLQLELAEDFSETNLVRESRIAAFRILQEATSNILRHAHATEALIRIASSAHQLELTVRDNGKGFDPAKVSAGIGLKNMQNRVALMGGSLQIDARPGHGCCLHLCLPVSPATQKS